MDEAFKSGQIVRNVVPVYGEVLPYDPQKTNQDPTLNPGHSGGPGARHGETVEIPVGHTGEVLSSTEFETVAIYPIHSTGELEPHMVRVESFTSDFKRTRRHNPFKLDRSDYDDPGRPIQASSQEDFWSRMDLVSKQAYMKGSDGDFGGAFQLLKSLDDIAFKMRDGLSDTWDFALRKVEKAISVEREQERAVLALGKFLDDVTYFLKEADETIDPLKREERPGEQVPEIREKYNVGERDESGRLRWAAVVYDPETEYLVDDENDFRIRPVDTDRSLPYVRQDTPYYDDPLLDKISPELIPLVEQEWERWEHFGDPTKPPVSGASRATFFYNGYVRKVPITIEGQRDNRSEFSGFASGTIPIPTARMEMDDNDVLVQEEVQSISDDLTQQIEFDRMRNRNPGIDPEEFGLGSSMINRNREILDEHPWLRAMLDDPQVGYDAGGELRAFDSFDTIWLNHRELERIERRKEHEAELERLRKQRHEQRDRDVRGEDGRIKWTRVEETI